MFRDLVKANRSYRGYDGSYQIDRDKLLSYVDLTRYAASSLNIQPLKYHIACEKEEVAKILPLTKFAARLAHLHLPHEGMNPTAFIVICQDKNLAPNIASFQRDVGIVAQTMLLAATEQGLGGCMIGNYNRKEVIETLNLPENIVPMLIVAFGKPDEEIVLTEIEEGESIKYYRDENDVHYVPKRKLEDIVITCEKNGK